MDTKLQSKEKDNFSEHIASENERKFFTKIVMMKTNSDAVLVDEVCNVTVKSEIKSETPFPDFDSHKQTDYVTKHPIKYIKTETSSNNCEIDIKSDTGEGTLVSHSGSQMETEFLPEDALMRAKEYNSYHEVDIKIEIKEEIQCHESETSSIYEDIKDGHISPVKSSRLCLESFFDDSPVKSPLICAEVPVRDTSFYNENEGPDSKSQETDITKIHTVEEHVHSEQSRKCSDVKINCKASYSKQLNLTHNDKSSHKCNICERSFRYVSLLKLHEFIHGGDRPYVCKICDKSFTRVSHLKRHKLIHEGKRSCQCKSCDKSFTDLSSLKRHNLIHEAKKPHQCKTCDQSFIHLSQLKMHNLNHEGKNPHQCKACDKNFLYLSDLKRHNFIHEAEGKKPYKCKTCDKRFIRLSDLKRHNLTHEGNKPYQCKICEKNFSQLSHLKRHNLIHEGKKPHQCKTCDKRFIDLSNLKRHSLIH